MSTRTDFQRAPPAPRLPATPFRFILHFVARYRWWYLAMVVFEAAHAVCSICLPYALGKVIKGVTESTGDTHALIEHLHAPLRLFVLLGVGEVVFARAGGSCQITIGPRQRQNVTRNVY